ncbi:MAG: Tol-Pal system subunit TolQ [Nitrospinota bacterium]|nr:MAG: Tol-Pal system subunit TolQ [Nitrospinota bacterium]
MGQLNWWALVLQAGPVGKMVLAMLGGFSLFSWAIILQKLHFFYRMQRDSTRFQAVFQSKTNLSVIYAATKKFSYSPLAKLFATTYLTLREMLRQDAMTGEGKENGGSEKSRLFIADVESLHRTLQQVANSEVLLMEKYLIFLATTASVTPFIGLFGTVWGVMSAFQRIGYRGGASLAVVAPGISEALIATAAGLAAAIPAVIAYNYFVNRIKIVTNAMDQFVAELLSYAERGLIWRG